jgi:ketosteroid isomerase-like protein
VIGLHMPILPTALSALTWERAVDRPAVARHPAAPGHHDARQDDKVLVLLDMALVVRATGKMVVQKVAHVWTFQDGRPIHFHDFQNSHAVAAALRGQ